MVNDGDKSTKEELEEKKKINQEKYGLSPEAVQAIKLPAPTAVCFYDVKKIMNPKNDLSTVERIEKLQELEKALLSKLERVIEEKKSKATSTASTATSTVVKSSM